jgi:hypothetical protein
LNPQRFSKVSGLQPTLLPRPTETLPQLLGFGEAKMR